MSKIYDIVSAATPGPWIECGHDRGGCRCHVVWGANSTVLTAASVEDDYRYRDISPSEEQALANARYAAMANPEHFALMDSVCEIAEFLAVSCEMFCKQGFGCQTCTIGDLTRASNMLLEYRKDAGLL